MMLMCAFSTMISVCIVCGVEIVTSFRKTSTDKEIDKMILKFPATVKVRGDVFWIVKKDDTSFSQDQKESGMAHKSQ